MKLRIALLLACGLLTEAASIAQADEQQYEQIAAGRYLTDAGDCVACHTAPGGKPFAGGLSLRTPFGTILSPNITPDLETGIGRWTDAQFLNAMQHGVDAGGHFLYPAFPYPYFTKVTANDILSIRAYLRTLEPVKNDVEANQLPFPFNIRASLRGWNWLNFTPGTYRSRSDKSDEWNRGAYLVEGLGHCGACHTPKTLTGGDDTSKALEGAVLDGWFAPNIGRDRRVGIGGWSIDDIVAYLSTGSNGRAMANGPMSEVVMDSTSKLAQPDLRAIAVYLKDFGKDAPAQTALASSDAAMQHGSALYRQNCSACHRSDGSASQAIFPSLRGSPTVQAGDATTLIRVVIQGTRAAATDAAPTSPAMPSFGWKLSDDDTADVLTYIRNAWGNAATPVTRQAVQAMRAAGP